MRLAVGSITVEDLEFGPSTALRDRTLVVNRDEIRQVVLQFQPNLALFPAQPDDVKDVSGGTAPAADYHRAILAAGPPVAAHLARAVQDASTDAVETFQLPACDPDLPRVVCLYQSYRHF